ncbi:MAG TPA: NAD-dependent epimerase/dehydratase family protein [Anaerolineae bacterium]|nr:NAD-dependent epimerase/dehydratase family protein [Anaerolineae bacterium]HIP69955.1 NAD-dependent epimerase/dehydratase family protein [Anaerolineae bacterium]
MILVSGAAGKTGRAVIEALVERNTAVRAFVQRKEQAMSALALGAAEAVVGDMQNEVDVRKAMAGVTAVYHICPNMHPEETGIGELAVRAAQQNSVSRFVYHSVLHPQVEAMPHHWQKMRVEEQLFISGLAFTILQPAAYMQNLRGSWDTIVEEGVYRVPYPPSTWLNMVDLRDVAEAAAVVLTTPGHEYATYELAGPENLSQTEIAALLQTRLNHSVSVRRISPAAWTAQARAAGLGQYQIETLLKMFAYYGRYNFPGNPQTLTWLLGRPPGTLADFLRRSLAP